MDPKVIIVGAGPAGISTWLHLQKHAPELANHTLVIDKAVFPRDKLCAGGVGGWSADVLRGLAVDIDIPSVFVSDVDLKFGNEGYRFHQPNFFRVVHRFDFDHALVKNALSRGLELHQDETFLDALREKNKLIVKTNRTEYSAKALLGADGALSVVSRKMMPSRRPHLAQTIQIYAKADAQFDTEFHEKMISIDFSPFKEGLQGYLWHFPCLIGGTPSIAHGIVDFRIHRGRPKADMKKIFSLELQSRNIHMKPKLWSSKPIRWFSKRDIVSQPNMLLVGDAAGIEPAFGGGIHLSLSYGEVAAWAVIDAFENNNFSFRDYGKRLRSHLVGEWITKCTRLALEMYGDRMNPLDAAREVFPESRIPPELLSQIASELEKAWRNS
ncbi:MAG TPA: NAD(P)/FAD-dependent oxidoreductase [Deltaproteobacteria bacterium]|nr:NAD(P)/FAD-dependent oxidoreductase [Deltaproteobacteria bacterium]